MTARPPLGREAPLDFGHTQKYPLRSLLAAAPITVNRALRLPYWHATHDQGGTSSCFPAGTLVRMADGSQKKIEDVRPLDSVLTAEGNTGTVLQSMARMHTTGMIRVKAWGHSHLRATPEHPFLTRRGYVAAGELVPGDEIAMPRYAPQTAAVLETAPFLAENRPRKDTKVGRRVYESARGRGRVEVLVSPVPPTIELTEDFGRIVGLWMAEGSYSRDSLQWHFGGHERDTLASELVGLLASCLGVEAILRTRGNGALVVSLYGQPWSKLFTRMLSLGAYDKRLPGALASGPLPFLESVLGGWLAGDGHNRRGRDSGVTVSRALANDMVAIGAAIGRFPSIRVSKGKPNASAATRRDRYDLEFAGESYRATQDDTHLWRRIRGTEEEDFAGYVFNIHVEGDESYVAEGIGVHNCVGHAAAMERAITNLAQNRLTGRLPMTRRYDPLDIWRRAKIIDGNTMTDPANDDDGTYVSSAYDVLRDEGAWRVKSMKLTEAGNPKVVGPWPARDLDEGVVTNRWAANVDEMRAAIASGVPVVTGTNWYERFFEPVRVGSEFWIGRGSSWGPVRGGHAVCIYGASDRRQAFRVKNSWTGFPLVWVGYEAMERLLSEAGEAVVAADR